VTRAAHLAQVWRRTVLALRAECPLVLPIRVVLDRRAPPRFGDGGELIGWSYVGPEEDGFRIVVRERYYERGARRPRRISALDARETLIHEWAHCMAWHSDHSQLQDHGPAWGVAYASAYRAVVED